MRGSDQPQSSLFSFIDLENRVPLNHPLRPIKAMCDRALADLNGLFDRLYSAHGRPSIPPEHLLRALLIQILFTVRSERQLMEQMNYNLLYRWFVGLGVDESVWHPTTFTQNRDRLLEHDVAKLFFSRILEQAKEQGLLSADHFTVDGTFIEAWASQKSFKPKDEPKDRDPNQSGGRNPSVDFKGKKRANDTHASVTDPDARLMRKGGDGAKLVHHGHIVTENRHGMVVATLLTIAGGKAEALAAMQMLQELGLSSGTVGADKGYDQSEFVNGVRALGLTPHVAQNTSNRASKIDQRTTSHPGYAISQRRRKIVEEVFGWMKVTGLMRKTRHRGTDLVGWMFTFTCAAFNLVRMRTLAAPPGALA
jgi:transposase